METFSEVIVDRELTKYSDRMYRLEKKSNSLLKEIDMTSNGKQSERRFLL